MRHTAIILLLILFFSCEDSPINEGLSDQGFEIKKLENVENKPWESGNFVSNSESEPKVSTLDEVIDILNILRLSGVEVELAWFNKGASSCGQLSVVVPNEVVLRVNKTSLGTIDPDEFYRVFEEVDVKNAFSCPLNVYEIKPR